jgi:hypothetical protein
MTRRVFIALILASSGMVFAGLVHAGPEVTFYVTVPLGSAASGHVLGLRLDHSAAPPAVRIITPDSPLNRRALLDLQIGADRALRLDLDRRLTWDINRQQWRDSSRPATFTLRLPTHSANTTRSARSANLSELPANPLRTVIPKPLAVGP